MKYNLYFLILFLAIVLSLCHKPTADHRRSSDVFPRNERQRHQIPDNCPHGHIRIAGECIHKKDFENLKIFGTILLIVLAIILTITLIYVIRKVMNKYGIKFSPIFKKKTNLPIVYPSNYYPQVIHRSDCQCRCASNEYNINNSDVGYTLLQNQSININS